MLRYELWTTRIESSSDRKMAWKITENINWETASHFGLEEIRNIETGRSVLPQTAVSLMARQTS